MSDPGKAVFLSYASQDAEAAKRICDALRAAGVEVWFDAEGGLEHGDEWDAKIRRQIKECVLFLPIISANTQAREEGYFRIEWELAAQRALGIASGVAFILPIVIDDTREPDALVPDRFRSVQWTRLRSGELTPEIKARFLKLWSHRAGVVKHEAAVGRDLRIPPSSSKAGFGDPALQSKPGWKAYAGLAVGVFALVAVVGWWMLRPPATVASVPGNSATPPPAIPAPPPAPVNPAGEGTGPRQLVAKARALFEALDSTRDDFKLAEEIIAQAKATGANDAEVWAADAQLNERYFIRGWDTSDARREAARAAAQRAQRLDPQSFEARYAQIGLLSYTGREGTEKEKLLLDLLHDRPTDHRVLRELGSTLDRQGRVDEGVAFMDQAAALPGGDPLALYNKSLGYWFAGRTVEAEAAMRASIAQKSFTGAMLMSVWYAMVLRGDLDGARATLEQIAPAELLEDRGCYFSYYLHCLRREPDAAIARLRNMPRDWISDNWYRGPKARLMGDALQQAGRAEAAAVEWRAALKLVDARLAASPTNGNQQFNRILLLVSLGEKAEAEKQFAVLVQLNGLDPTGAVPVPGWVTELSIALGRKTEALRQIAVGLKQDRRAVTFTAAILRLDPEYDSLRGEPEFARLIAQAEAIERAAALPARDWPKDAELRRATQLIFALDAIAEDFALAEDLVKAALAARPNDPEAVTIAAVVAQEYLTRGFDTTQVRRAQVQKLTERAVQLAPDSPDALAALGRYLLFINAQLPRAEELLRRAIALQPDEPRYHRTLYGILGALRPGPDTDAFGTQMVARFPADVLIRYDKARGAKDRADVVAFEQELDKTLALAPLATAMVWKSWVMLDYHADVPGMKTWLDRVPGRQRVSTRFAYALSIYAGISGDTAAAIKLLNDFPATWLTDFDFTGPKALLLGDLLVLGGRKDLARLQYESALAEIKREEAANPTDLRVRRAELWTLLGLGRRDEVQAVLPIMMDSVVRPYQVTMNNSWWSGPVRSCLLLGERAFALALLKEAAADPTGRTILRNQFQADPRMAPFRDDPEIKALLAEPGEKK